MENKPSGKRQRIFYQKVDQFKSVRALGKLLFFDYAKNKFGRISGARSLQGIHEVRIQVSEKGLLAKRALDNDDLIVFTLNKGYQGFYATEVIPLDEVPLEMILSLSNILTATELERIIGSSNIDFNILSIEHKAVIESIILKDNSIKAWELVIKLKDESLRNNYINSCINELKDDEKLSFLEKSFDTHLLSSILLKWNNKEKETTLKLVRILEKNRFSCEDNPGNFIMLMCNIDWNFTEIYSIHKVFKSPQIHQEALSRFSFNCVDPVGKLKSLIHPENFTDEIKQKLKRTLERENALLSIDVLFGLFINLREYDLIQNKSQLLLQLVNKEFDLYALKRLSLALTDDCLDATFSKIVSNNIKNIPDREIIELIKVFGDRYKLAQVFIYEYCNYNKNSADFKRMLSFFKEQKEIVLTKYFVDTFHTHFSEKYPIEILELAILTSNVAAQKNAYSKILFANESAIIKFMDKSVCLNIAEEIKEENKPLTAFINFLNSTTDFSFTEDCKKFFSINKGIVQCLVVKFLIYQYSQKAITKARLIEIIDSFKWTEASALLIRAFIQEQAYTEKILLDKLNVVFKEHFEVLASEEFDPKSFLENFTIRNILTTCNGRKYYNGEFWQKNGLSRWYYKGNVSTYTRETLNCYCEGRPWKKEALWNATTNTPSVQQYEFYWCKTSYCAARNDIAKVTQPFNLWTLSEIAIVLGITIEKVALATLAGWVNRMNQIIEHLFCRKCNNVLRPFAFRPATLGYYAVPLFHCINDKCTEKKIIRFTHCLNSKCESHKTSEPLDSRDCQSCRPKDPNHIGLQCNYCGAQCPACAGNYTSISVEEMW
ncbi:MAG: hypothetical protein KA149_01460 [Chitinophagales bacterium]|nr:hypothetical protein [Chitinophagales bacterium]